MTGKEEADAFVARKYVDLHRSTLRKVDVFCNLAVRAYDNKLETLATWKEAHGLSYETFIHLAKAHPIVTGVTVLGSVVSAIVTILRLIQRIF